MRNVLESQLPRNISRATPAVPPAGYTERITIRTTLRQFESFLRSISRCSSLLDARRLKNDVVGEIRRTRILLGKSFYIDTDSHMLTFIFLTSKS